MLCSLFAPKHFKIGMGKDAVDNNFYGGKRPYVLI